MSRLNIKENIPLAQYTTLNAGGPAEKLVELDSAKLVPQAIKEVEHEQLWVLGYGANVLISDNGLTGLTLIIKSSQPKVELNGKLAIADAAVWWDDFVQHAISNNLWGLELTSGIPGGVGAAVVGNIAAYGQAVEDTLSWVDCLNKNTGKIERLQSNELNLDYRFSDFQAERLENYIILKAAFQLASEPTGELKYRSALNVAGELNLKPNTLNNRRKIIMEARRQAGSLYSLNNPKQINTAGSFFRNPKVTPQLAEELVKFEEGSISGKQILAQNKIHSGESMRVSAAHVLLAAGFERGQSWGNVRLHPDHVLKIENTANATAQEIHNVAQEIIDTVKAKLDIDLEPEVRFLGQF